MWPFCYATVRYCLLRENWPGCVRRNRSRGWGLTGRAVVRPEVKDERVAAEDALRERAWAMHRRDEDSDVESARAATLV